MSVEPTTSAAMDCADVDRALEAYLDGELDQRDRAETDAHLALCERCRRVTDERAHVRTAIRRCLRSAMGEESVVSRAPPALRVRIVEALEHERRPAWRRAITPLRAAAVAACAAGFFLVAATRSPADPLADEAVQRHVRDLPLEVTTASVGPESVASWFEGKLDFNPRPPRFAEPEVRLVGARLSHIADRPAAYMRYDLPRGRAGLFIIEDPQRRFGDGGREVRIGPHVVHIVSAHGYNIAVWRRNDIVYSLVADLDEEQLATLVRSAAMQVGDR